MNARRWRVVASVLSWLVPLCIYAVSARRDVWFWDTGEMDTVPWILGIAHPTGFPAYVLLGYVFSHAIPIGSVALRMSLMSACATAGAAYFVFCIAEDGGARPWIATASAWLFAFGSIVWTRGTRAEVHALAACAFAATIYYALRWYASGSRRDLYAAAIAWGIGMAVHPALLLALPAIAFLTLTRRGAVSSADIARAACLGIVSMAVWYAYLPLRSWYVAARGADPSRALGIAGGPFWDYDHPASLHGFAALASGGDFSLGSVINAILSGSSHGLGITMYWPELLNEVSPLGVAAIAVGVLVAWRRSPGRAAALMLFAIPCVVFAAGFPPESDPRRYFIGSFAVAAVFIAAAVEYVAARVPRLASPAVVAFALLALLMVVENRWVFAQVSDERARAVIVDVQRYTPPNAILVANWLDAPPLAYAAYVEHSLRSRTIAAAWVGDIGPHVGLWLRSRPVFVVGTSNAGGLHGYRLVALAAGSPVYRLTP